MLMSLAAGDNAHKGFARGFTAAHHRVLQVQVPGWQGAQPGGSAQRAPLRHAGGLTVPFLLDAHLHEAFPCSFLQNLYFSKFEPVPSSGEQLALIRQHDNLAQQQWLAGSKLACDSM